MAEPPTEPPNAAEVAPEQIALNAAPADAVGAGLTVTVADVLSDIQPLDKFV